MRRNVLFTGLILGLLLLPPPAFAVSYSGWGLLDLTTLTLSVISVSPPFL